jgi:hypothetical protein
MQEAGPGRSPAASLVRSTAARLGRVDRHGLKVALAYPLIAAAGVVMVADLVGSAVASAFDISKDMVATFAVVLGVLFFAWWAEPIVKWVLEHWTRQETADAIRKEV